MSGDNVTSGPIAHPLEGGDSRNGEEQRTNVLPNTAAASMGEGSTAVRIPRSVKKVSAGIVGAIGILSGILGIWPFFFSDNSRISSLDMSVEPFRAEEVFHYALPVTVDLSTFPEGGPVCTPEQKAWLDEHGTSFQRDYLMEIRNTASGGSAISLDSVSGQGESTSPTERRVTVQCNMTGESGVVTEPARVDLTTGAGAFFDNSGQGGGEGRGQALTPLAYNLRPGEVGQVVLTMSSTADFTGSLVAEVTVGKDSEVLPFRGAQEGQLSMPGVESPRSLIFDVESGGLSCRIVPNVTDNGRSECSTEEYFNPVQ